MPRHITLWSEHGIKKAFWSAFHKRGEVFIGYCGSETENEESTKEEWVDFLDNLKKGDENMDDNKTTEEYYECPNPW